MCCGARPRAPTRIITLYSGGVGYNLRCSEAYCGVGAVIEFYRITAPVSCDQSVRLHDAVSQHRIGYLEKTGYIRAQEVIAAFTVLF